MTPLATLAQMSDEQQRLVAAWSRQPVATASEDGDGQHQDQTNEKSTASEGGDNQIHKSEGGGEGVPENQTDDVNPIHDSLQAAQKNNFSNFSDDSLSWLGDAFTRVTSGRLYKIKVKAGENSDDDVIQPFIPNADQLSWLRRMWTRNLILKCRQRGFTTLIAIIWLDHALFVANQYCGMIAQNKEAAENIFRDKVLLAYDHLPATLKAAFPMRRCSASEVEFAHNNSKIRVATSVRSGTLDRLHVSEFGKISARDPAKAQEVISGSFPAVPADGIIVVESTAEGRDGAFFAMTQQAMAHAHAGRELNKKQFRLQFYPWWGAPEYTLPDADAANVAISPADNSYFDDIEGEVRATGTDCTISHGQRAWWVTTRDDEFGGEDEIMWQEYPSTPAEAFKVSVKGVYYAKQLSAARKNGRIGRYPYLPGIPVNTFWDIGGSDGTGIWLHQKIGGENRFIHYIENWEEPYNYYTKELQKWSTQVGGVMWGNHNLPHDAQHQRQQQERVSSPLEDLESTGLGGTWQCVAKVDDLQNGIQKLRDALASCTFDEAGCKEGLEHLWNYRKKWNKQASSWSETPDKAGGHSEAADALRQFAQAGANGISGSRGLSADSAKRWKNRKRGR